MTKHFNILEDWRDRQDFLEMILEVYQFAREAAVAEAWLIAQELQFNTHDFGETLNETLNLLQRHLVLERNLAVQDERFEALRKLTSFEEMSNSLTEEMKKEKSRNRQRRLNKLIEEFRTPPPTPERQRKSIQAELNEDVIVPAMSEKAHSSMPLESKIESKEMKSPKEGQKLPGQIQSTSSAEPKMGVLFRKHEWESSTKKAGNRKWNEVFVVIDNDKMTFYKDKKHYDDDKKQHTFKNEKPLELLGGISSPALNYKKRQNVFRIRLESGAEYLFESSDSADMNRWVEKINEIGGVDASQSKYSTLPNTKTDFEPETGDKRKFPTLGRKQKS